MYFNSYFFPNGDLKLSKLYRSYRVIASCHHRGSIKSEHWTTKVCTSMGTWYELDDLNVKPSSTNPPGISDSSVTVLLLIAEDKLVIPFEDLEYPGTAA